MLVSLSAICMETTRLLLANDHPLIRSSLRALLEREPDFRIVGEAADTEEALLVAEYLHPHLAILDLNLKPAGGIATARRIAGEKSAIKLVVLADQNQEEYAIEAFKAGVRGYVAAESAASDLVRGIRAVLEGRCFVSSLIRRPAQGAFGS